MSYRSAAAIVNSADDTGQLPPVDPEQRMHYAWRKLEKLTLEMAVRNGTPLDQIRGRIKDASDRSISILEQARGAA